MFTETCSPAEMVLDTFSHRGGFIRISIEGV